MSKLKVVPLSFRNSCKTSLKTLDKLYSLCYTTLCSDCPEHVGYRDLTGRTVNSVSYGKSTA